MSFNLFGALSPTKELLPPPATDEHKKTDSDNSQSERPSTPKRNVGQAEIESSYFKVGPEILISNTSHYKLNLYKYDGTFSDHLEMLVQMGYVVLFSSAFPLAGVCALANNLLEIRTDAFKLAHVHQRFVCSPWK